jgi:hypothetical protein
MAQMSFRLAFGEATNMGRPSVLRLRSHRTVIMFSIPNERTTIIKSAL